MPECSCEKCANLCTWAPGWMWPDEARAAIAAGLSDRLMIDWLEPDHRIGNDRRVYVLCPATVGREGGVAEEDLFTILICGKGVCTFLKDGLCEIHSTVKPQQCRDAMACTNVEPLSNIEIGRAWIDEQDLIEEWKRGMVQRQG